MDVADDQSSICTEDAVGGLVVAASAAPAAAPDTKGEGNKKATAATAAPGANHSGGGGDKQQQLLQYPQPSPLSPLLALEAELVAKYSAGPFAATPTTAATATVAPAEQHGVRFMVDAAWLRQWDDYVRGQPGCLLPPGALTNAALYDRRTLRLRQGLAQGVDYQAMNPAAYYILAVLYGTAADDDADGPADGGSSMALPPEICRFGSNIYNAEVPESVQREVAAEAKQLAHAEVNRLSARQRRSIIRGCGGEAAGDEARSIVSSCSSFPVGVQRPRDVAADAVIENNDEAATSSCCERWLYPLLFALAPQGFHRYAQQQQEKMTHGRTGVAAAAEDVQSILSASLTFEMGEGEGTEDDDLLLWRSKPAKGLRGLGDWDAGPAR